MTRYEQGFMNKCAEYGVDGRYVVQALNKQAALGNLGSVLKRLWVKAHPKVNPEKLNWFTRPFTKTKHIPTLLDQTVPGVSSYGPYGAYGGGNAIDTVRNIRSVTRLSPERIAAALAGIGGTAGIAADVLSGKGAGPSPAPAAPKGGISPSAKALLATLGVGGVAAGGYAIAKKKGKKAKDEEDDKKKNKRQ